MKLLRAYKKNVSERGVFLGIVNFGEWEEVNYVETKAGQSRGGHYHKEATELFFIIKGEIDIKVRDINGGLIEEFTATKGSIFFFDPYEVHTFVCKSDCQWINVMSKRINDSLCDIYQYKDKE